MTVGEVEDAAAMQAIIRGQNTRADDPRILQAVENGDLAALRKLLASGVPAPAAALEASLSAPVRAVAAELVKLESAWGLDASDLAIWNKVQAALYPTPTEDDPEPAPGAVDEEGWQTEALTELFGVAVEGEEAKTPPADPTLAYAMKRIVKLGCYGGGRAPPSDAFREPAFDTEATARAGYGVCLLPKGHVYAGFMADGKREGTGALATREGATYVGGWRKGLKHGEGRQAYPDGSVYEGGWRYGMRHGRGVYTYANGDVYAGGFFTGKKHGAGKYISRSGGAKFSGVWAEGELSKASVQATAGHGASLHAAFVGGKPAGAAAYLLRSGAVGGHFPPAPAPLEEGEEAGEAPPYQWTSLSLVPSDRTSYDKLSKQFGGGDGPAAPKLAALLVAPDYPQGGVYPPLDLQPAATQLANLLVGKLGVAASDVKTLCAAAAVEAVEAVEAVGAVLAEDGVTVEAEAVAAVAAQPAVVPATKEAVLAAAEALAASLGRGDVAFLGFLCHGKRLLDLDAGAEAPAEGLCLIDAELSEEELAELVAKFAARSVHLFLYLDSCFDAPFLKAPKPNFAALTATLEADAPPEAPAPAEGEEPVQPPPRHGAYFAQNMTSWLAAALDGPVDCYGALLSGMEAARASGDERTALRQAPMLYTADAADKVLAPLA